MTNDVCYMWIPSPTFKTLKAIFFFKFVSTALLNHIRELRMKMGLVSRKLWRPRKLRPPDLRDSRVFFENSAECWYDGRISCSTRLLKKKKSGLTGILVYFHFDKWNTFFTDTLFTEKAWHLNRWWFKKFTECSIIPMDFIKLLDFLHSGTFKTI